MCIPKPPNPAPPPSGVPSMQAADGLDLAGGVLRGSAGLGRLKLRTGAAPTQTAPAPKPLSAALGLATGGDTGGSSGTGTGGDSSAGAAGNYAPSPFNRTPNTNLRIS